MKRKKAASIEAAAKKVAKERKLAVEVVHKAILDAIAKANRDRGDGYLSFAGILPVDLPDGTRIAILPDIHAPAHHAKIMWAVMAFLKDFRPHILILIGDVADVFGLSRWPKPPRVSVNLQDELDETRRLIDKLISVSGAYHTFIIMGNHEDRVRRYLTDPASQLSTVVSHSTKEPILSFHELMGYKPGEPVTFIYDLHEAGGFGGALVVNGDMEYHHGFIVRPKPGASPRADADRTGRSVTHGHTHRKGMNARLTTRGMVRGIEGGHLVDPTHAFMGYANLLNNWHPGLDVAIVAGGKVHTQSLPIKQVAGKNGQPKFVFTYAGKVYTQSDR